VTRHHARLTLNPAFRVGEVNRRVFGSFVEHMGRCVYTGISEPGHPAADDLGLRADVADLTQQLGVSVVRYPGGNFVSSYRWEDGVGPVTARPIRPDLAWRSIESNEFGLNDFLQWCRRTGVEPMLAVNLGTRGVQEACDLLEYCNIADGTYWSELRIKHGFPEPHGVTLWCLGNEMDGPWQIGHKTADEYGRLAAETAKAMKRLDPSVRLVACGSSSSSLPTFGQWEATVLEHTFDYIDFVSLHAYYDPAACNLPTFLASAEDMDQFITAVTATADFVAAKRRSRKRIQLSFDEWNVWSASRFAGEDHLEWARVPRLIEQVYDVVDAAVVGSLLITLLRHANRLTVACQAQLVNVLGPIMTQPGGPAWRQTIFHPFALTAKHARGAVLDVRSQSPTYGTERYGQVPWLVATATYDQASGNLALFAVNRSQQPLALDVELQSFPGLRLAGHTVVADDDIRAANTMQQPDRVIPRQHDGGGFIVGRMLHAELPGVSWNCIRLATGAAAAGQSAPLLQAQAFRPAPAATPAQAR
jgi:alpha-L-arabinofuranosidase